MPDLTTCVRIGERIFCWDQERKRIVELHITDVPFAECPETVVADIIAAIQNGRTKMGKE
jgi:hypothetical protein